MKPNKEISADNIGILTSYLTHFGEYLAIFKLFSRFRSD
ncbi:hypothetical protein M917_2170 [Psychrobacter aquaticus CMS 56]|uniref:Uncharacterized protein n=1 Tax=Psychrobacter aquaticus CMS 56 TaxID=1354303 RepID=U4T7V8_9GAMM|nr:hypothetical protein M917_2170 [Psychrobacter aquaticus CMS 56]